jgi:3-methyladenine DNA glycosylase/8-oxoguanine DNA glycosylase
VPQPKPLTRIWRPPFPLSIHSVLAVHRRGHADPAFQVSADGAVWRTCLTPDGPGTLRVAPGPQTAAAAAWGPGARWLLGQLPELLGACDDPASFAPVHAVLRAMAARHRGLRVGRTSRVLEALVPAVLEQKVVGAEAFRAWRLLLTRYGEAAPGAGPGGPVPSGMRVFPHPQVWASIPSWEWHRAGVEGVRAAAIIAAASAARRVEETAAMEPAAADGRLQAIAGIGPWTSAEVRQRAAGDADAVSVGDYHLPSLVGWALAGRAVGDSGMLELLVPYRGHRYRVTRLLELSGLAPPRRGPRLAARDYGAF